jgi:predicted peptidase
MPEAAMGLRLSFSAVAICMLLVDARVAAAADATKFVPYNFIDSANRLVLPGQLHVPAECTTDPKTRRPLILFLHGSGEAGTDNLNQINGNIDPLLAAAEARGAFLYAPQSITDWDDESFLADVMTMIDRAIAERGVDRNRIYVTGLSMGGGGVWNLVSRFPDRFAAAVPISASDPTSNFEPANLAHQPIWAFHARNDTVVPVQPDRDLINNLLMLADRPTSTFPPTSDTSSPNVQFDDASLDLHYTDFRGDHGIWPEIYNTPALYEWMFAHGATR